MARIHRAAVESARQVAEKPTLNAREGREIPCQPCRNSSISPVTGRIGEYSGSESEGTIAEIGRTRPVDGELSPSTPEQCRAFRDMGIRTRWELVAWIRNA